MGWKIRQLEYNVGATKQIPDYGSNKEYFSIKIHHSGTFVDLGQRCYVGGRVDHVDYCTKDEMSKVELGYMAAELGLGGYIEFYHTLGDINDSTSLRFIENDVDVMNLDDYSGSLRIVSVFINHGKLDSKSIRTQFESVPIQVELQEQSTQQFPDVDDPLGYVRDNDSFDEDIGKINPKKLENEPDITLNDLFLFTNEMIDQNNSGESDGEVSYGSDSVNSDFVEDSDFNWDDDNGDFDNNVDPDAEWCGVRNNSDESLNVEHRRIAAKEKKIIGSTYKGFLFFNPNVNMKDIKFSVGLCFVDTETFRQAVRQYAIDHGRFVKFVKNFQKKVQAKCKNEHCPWVIYAARFPGEDIMQVKTYHGVHECPRQEKVTQANSRFLANKYAHKLISNPNWPINSMLTIMQKENKVSFTKFQMYRAKKKALAIRNGDGSDQFALIWRYAEAIKRSNSQSTVKIKSKLLGNKAVFKRIYICWGATKCGILDGCRRVICLDGCHLKSTHGGVFLTTVGIDANNCMYPFAYAIVEKEKKKSWFWFLNLLVEDLNMHNGCGWTIMSDKQKGLVDTINQLLPQCEHRFCVRHLYENFKMSHTGLAFKDLLWKAARATRVVEFNKVMGELKERDAAAFHWLASKPPTQWSKSHFSFHSKSDILLNNMCESFNALILRVRAKPLIHMLEDIRIMLMKRLGIKRQQALKYHGEFCPNIETTLEELKKKSMDYLSTWNDHLEFEVVGCHGDKAVVHLGEKTCSCRRWQLTGIPCPHAISGIYYMGQKPEAYVDECYRTETCLKIYSHLMKPMLSEEESPQPETVQSPIVALKIENMSGRPKKHKRKLQTEELGQKKAVGISNSTQQPQRKLGKKGIIMTCQYCSEKGHNVRGCPVKKNNSLADHTLDILAPNVPKRHKSKTHKKQVSSEIENAFVPQDQSHEEKIATQCTNKQQKLQVKEKDKSKVINSNTPIESSVHKLKGKSKIVDEIGTQQSTINTIHMSIVPTSVSQCTRSKKFGVQKLKLS